MSNKDEAIVSKNKKKILLPGDKITGGNEQIFLNFLNINLLIYIIYNS